MAVAVGVAQYDAMLVLLCDECLLEDKALFERLVDSSSQYVP
jgi:hypothetical protein